MEPAQTLSRKKMIRVGHRGTVTKMLGDVKAALIRDTPDLDCLSRLKLILNEKPSTLNRLDSEIIELVEDSKLEAHANWKPS